MKKLPGGKTLLIAGIALLSSPASWAAFVTWELNPNGLNGAVGSSSHSYTVSGSTITANGFDFTSAAGPNTPHNLYYKNETPINGAVERGLGLTGIPDSELFSNANGTPANFIQLDLRSILAQGFTGGQIMVGSVQQGESFRLFGSNSLGTLGTVIGSPFGSAFDDQFVSINNFGSFRFISVAAGTGDVLPIAFRASPVPEMSALLPIIGLLAAISFTHILRRRRAAQLATSMS